MLTRTFAEQGFESDTGNSVESARLYADTEQYDIICVNQQLKDGTGEAFVDYCNTHERLKDTPILFLTENDGLVAEALDVRVDGVIHELNEGQVEDQIVHFIERQLDPVFYEGRIMLVEDDDETRELLGRTLEKAGWTVNEAINGREALDSMASDAPTLILLDLMMPVMDGFEFLAAMREHAEWDDIPVVVITAKTLTPEDRARLNGRVEEVVRKSAYTREQLLEHVRDAVAARSRYARNE